MDINASLVWYTLLNLLVGGSVILGIWLLIAAWQARRRARQLRERNTK